MTRLWLLILLLASCAAACAQDGPTAAAPQPEPVSIEAHVIEATPPNVHAEGDVLFMQGQKRLSADEVFYNYEEQTGLLTGASFTTCSGLRPDYRITATEIRLTHDQRLKLRRVRIYLGNFRLISLPKLTIDIGPGAERQTFIPRPGYNTRDGIFLTSRYPLVDEDRSDLNVQSRIGTKAGIQGGITGGYALRGTTRVASPYVSDFDTELRRQSLLMPLVDNIECVFPQSGSQEPLLALFGAALFRERAFDIDRADLLTTRLPELGVRYVSPQVCMVDGNGLPSVGVQAEARSSWGRFRESPGGIYINRWDARGLASTTIATYGKYTALRGAGLVRYSSYEHGDRYGVLGGSLDLSRIFPGGSFASVRLIAHTTSGSTPFEFDDVDILHELQGAGRYVRGRNTFGILLHYDLDDQSLRDWEFSYARRLDCMEPSITWRNRLNEISFNIRVLGL